ncbi:hypothetical protein BH11ACT8_BH11ACT8_06570 [soil metagenome]
MSTLSERLEAARRASATVAAEDDAAPTETPFSPDDPLGLDAGAPPQAPPKETAQPSAPGIRERAAAPRTNESTTTRRPMSSGATDRIDDLKSSVHVELLKQLGPHLYDSDMDQNELDQRVRTVLADVLGSQDRPLSTSDRARVTQEISDDILGYGPIEPYLRDPEVSEIMVNGYSSIWLEKAGKLMAADAQFTDENHLRRIIDKIVSRIGRRVDESSPMVDARLPDGSRVNAVVPPLAVDGSALTIRKFSADPLTVDDLINFGSLTPQTADFIDACVRGRLNIIVSGSTGAGKTTTLNVLSSFIPNY